MSNTQSTIHETSPTVETPEKPMWRPLDALQRRVLGVLIEKAKTTPDSYPMTLNSIKTACNQKSNRKPQMELGADDVEATLDELREMGVVSEIQGDGRVAKYRHKAYQWLGVEKAELAVLAELILRGEQTVGELRGRASRMEPIDGLESLNPILASLREKNLLVELTPAGRGQIVTHGLYQSGECPTADSWARPTSAEHHSPAASDGEITELREMILDLQARVSSIENRLGSESS